MTDRADEPKANTVAVPGSSEPDAPASEIRPKFVGARVKRLEDPRLLTGSGAFVDDRRVPGLLHVAFRRSDHAHALITGIDTSAAEDMKGIVGIFRADDIEPHIAPIRATSRSKNYHATSQPILSKEKVRYVGEPIVAVVAQNRYLAEDAIEQILIDFEPLPGVVDPDAAAAPGSPILHDEIGTNILVSREFAKGDIDLEMSAAPIRVKDQFRFHRKTPVAMENRAYLAEYDGGKDSLTLHSSTQIPGIVRDALVDLLNLEGHQMRVIAPDVGGSFGGKGSLYPEEVLVSLLARQLGQPVKWTSDRLEDLTCTSHGFDEIIDAELGLDSDGRILAVKADVIGDVGAYSIYPWTAALEPVQVISFIPGPYRVPAYRGTVRAVSTSKAPMGPYRGVGRPTSTFVMERLLDQASRKLDLDPKEIRLRNLIADDEFPYKAPSGIVWDRSSFTDCLNQACNKIDYGQLRRQQVEARESGRLFGVGIASYAELTGIGSRIAVGPGMPMNTGTETATVSIDSSGSVTAAFGIASHGQGLETTLAQVVADELGARVENVRVIHGDSAAVTNSTGTYASRSAVLAGGAGTLAAKSVREKLVRCAAHIFGVPEHEIDLHDGEVRVPGTNHSMRFRDLARTIYSQMGSLPIELRNEVGDLSATRVYDPVFGTTSAAAHIALVELDPDTYKVTIRQYIVAEDCGQLINPLIVDGQVHGGVAQGIGAALFEEVVYDETGQIMTASLVDYVIPSAEEIPMMDIVHLQSELPDTIGGYRGMGEGGTIGAPAAIANAISDALAPMGIEINELPITPERLYRLIARSQNQSAGENP